METVRLNGARLCRRERAMEASAFGRRLLRVLEDAAAENPRLELTAE